MLPRACCPVYSPDAYRRVGRIVEVVERLDLGRGRGAARDGRLRVGLGELEVLAARRRAVRGRRGGRAVPGDVLPPRV